MLSRVAVVADDEIEAVIGEIRAACRGDRIVFVSGNFNIIHPGHLRLLNFAAECGDMLVVGVNDDSPPNTILPAELRLEGIRSIGVVDYALLLRVPPEDFIARLKPAVVVKGKEHEARHNVEREVVQGYGGRLLFSSGDVRFSSLDLLRQELQEPAVTSFNKPIDFVHRHGFELRDLVSLVDSFSKLRVVVVGDLIVDEYITCDPLGMSQEDATIVVLPLNQDRFMGGASCVAAHANAMGAHVDFFCVTGSDEVAQFARKKLQSQNLNFDFLEDPSRPTTLKQRFRANNKTLLRVSHLRQHDIGADLMTALVAKITAALENANVLMFSDFNYGCLPQPLVDQLRKHCIERGIMMTADSQASSQFGDVSRFKCTNVLTPTEYEARLAMRDSQSGLAVLAERLRQEAKADHVVVTLAKEGVLIQSWDHSIGTSITDRIPAFNTSPKDVTGAGDSLFTCVSLALAAGADIWRSAYLGSVAAALQVSRVGNQPITRDSLVAELGP